VLLGELAAAHLIAGPVPDRFVRHALLRAYAATIGGRARRARPVHARRAAVE